MVPLSYITYTCHFGATFWWHCLGGRLNPRPASSRPHSFSTTPQTHLTVNTITGLAGALLSVYRTMSSVFLPPDQTRLVTIAAHVDHGT